MSNWLRRTRRVIFAPAYRVAKVAWNCNAKVLAVINPVPGDPSKDGVIARCLAHPAANDGRLFVYVFGNREAVALGGGIIMPRRDVAMILATGQFREGRVRP